MERVPAFTFSRASYRAFLFLILNHCYKKIKKTEHVFLVVNNRNREHCETNTNTHKKNCNPLLVLAVSNMNNFFNLEMEFDF